MTLAMHLSAADATAQDADPHRPADHAVDQAVHALTLLDSTIVSVDYAGLPLEHVLLDLSRQSPLPIRADWLTLQLLGVETDTPIDMKVDNVPLSTVLGGMLLHVGTEFDRPTYEYHEGRIIISTIATTGSMAMTATYNIRDLLGDEATVKRLKADAPDPTLDDADTADDDSSEQQASPEQADTLPVTQRTPGQVLLELIADHVDPDAWLEFGGTRAKISEHQGILLVSAPATLHKKLRDAIEQLRLAIPSNVWIDAAVVTLSFDAHRNLVRRYRHGTSGLARALLRDASTTIVWRNRAAVVAIGETFKTDSRHGESHIRLAVTPSLTDDTQMLRLLIDAHCDYNGSQASVTTTTTCPGRSAAAIVELGSMNAPDELRLLILIPATG